MNDTRELALKVDELVMSKKDVLDMFDGLIKRSKRGKKNPWSFLYQQSLRGFKAGVIIAPEKVITVIWSDILRFFNAIIAYNQTIKEGEDSPLAKLKTFEKFKQEIKEGNW